METPYKCISEGTFDTVFVCTVSVSWLGPKFHFYHTKDRFSRPFYVPNDRDSGPDNGITHRGLYLCKKAYTSVLCSRCPCRAKTCIEFWPCRAKT
jgi:hypothetical protein